MGIDSEYYSRERIRLLTHFQCQRCARPSSWFAVVAEKEGDVVFHTKWCPVCKKIGVYEPCNIPRDV